MLLAGQGGGEHLSNNTVHKIAYAAKKNPLTPFFIITNGRYLADGLYPLEKL